MATLKRLKDNAVFQIPAQALIGRSDACALKLDDPYMSAEHAKMTWNGARWEVRDLGSRNGTFVDGKRIEVGRPTIVTKGTQLGFGEEVGFECIEITAPIASARNLATREVVQGATDVLVLPSIEKPELSIYPDPTGKGWLVEDSEGEAKTIHDQATVEAGGQKWQVDLPVVSEATPMADMAMTLENVIVRFAVPRNEETVEITLIRRGIEHVLERREHGYLLLTLARARLQDEHLPQSQRGWRSLEQLSSMLKIDRNSINVATHRARSQFALAGLEGAGLVVEARRGARRLGIPRFEIVELKED